MSKVIVCGSINMDIVARVHHHPVPGETVAGIDQNYYPGGKGANQAVASALSGTQTIMIGAVGGDPFGGTLIAFLDSCNVDTTHVEISGDQPSGSALIAVEDKGQNVIIINAGANGTLDDSVSSLVEIDSGDVVLAQYETPLVATLAIFAKAKSNGAITILNPAPAGDVPKELLDVTDYLVVNEIELGMVSDVNVSPEPTQEEIELATKSIRAAGCKSNIILTLGARGVQAFLVDGQVVEIAGIKVDVQDTTGAGDCFVGNFASKLAQGGSVESSLNYANTAASISVQRDGAGPSMPTKNVVDSAL